MNLSRSKIGSKFSHEIRPCEAAGAVSYNRFYPSPQYKKSNDTVRCSSSNQSQKLALIAGNFKTIGSKFSHEIRIAKLLASLATTDTILRTPVSQHKRAMNFSRSKIDKSQLLAFIKRKI